MDIPADKWAGAWLDPNVTRHQLNVARADLASWKAGGAHHSYDALAKLLRGLPEPPARFLEIGCASGYNKIVLDCVTAEQTKYVGVDVAPNQVDAATQEHPGIEVYVADCLSLPFKDKSFDVVCIAGLIQHLADYRPAILEARRVSSKFVMLHRVICTAIGEDWEYLHAAYDTEFPEREVSEIKLLEFCQGNGLDLCDSKRWGDASKQFNASYTFLKV